MNFEHSKTEAVIKCFEEISKIPRCSKNEEQIALWLIKWAEDRGYEVDKDKVNNIVIRVPGTKGFENSPIVVLQGHMDMVCEKLPESTHDFCKDPIKFVYEGDWLTADGTTLGADNGIALAMAMVMAEDSDVEHGPLELLFTVDEETGLTGANALEPGFIKGKILINIDSEDEGVFTVGCAGGINSHLTLPLEKGSVPEGFGTYRIVAGGMKGGHSGIDIGVGKANAMKILGRVMDAVSEKTDLRVADIKGGSAHNAIPRDADAVVMFNKSAAEDVKSVIEACGEVFLTEYKATDPDIFVKIENESDQNEAFSMASTKKLIEFIYAMPHGVAAMSKDIEGLIETSNNFANIKVDGEEIKVLSSQRSSIVSKIKDMTKTVQATAIVAGGSANTAGGYPPWQPNMDSKLLAKSLALYEEMFNKKPVVEVIHAGLECGIIGDKNPGMDMISIGPDLKYPHCPDEKVSISAIGKVWDFTVRLLKELK